MLIATSKVQKKKKKDKKKTVVPMTQPLVLVSVQSGETVALCCCSPGPCLSFNCGVWGIDIVQNTKLPKGQGCVLCSEPRYNEMY